jgi:glucose-1-phosphate thymidylyltransferase
MDFAIVDATVGHTEQPLCSPGRSRYTTPIANLPLICHVFDELAGSGIDQARVIAGPGVRDDLERILGRGRQWGVELSYSDAPGSERRTTVLSEIEQALDRGPVLLHPGDCLFRSQVTAMRERFRAGDVDSVLPEQASGTPVRSPSDRRVSETLLVLGQATRPLFGDLLSPASDGEDLIETLLHSDCRLAVCELTEQWCYNDSTEALLAANRMMLDALALSPVNDDVSDENQIHGRVTISPNARISNSVVNGPVAIADRAVVDDSFIGPYTAIGPGAVLSGTEIENAMVLSGAKIRHPGFRIEASIIGEGSHVARSFALPSGLHMRLGPDSRVTFS